jgi:CRISPR/Cas system endoribonuclease Cas6 (RAMP superfamily)
MTEVTLQKQLKNKCRLVNSSLVFRPNKYRPTTIHVPFVYYSTVKEGGGEILLGNKKAENYIIVISNHII